MNVIAVHVDTPEKKLVWDARHKLGWSTESFFHESAEYQHEDKKIHASVVQKHFIEYLHGANPKEYVIDFAIDVLAERVRPQ